MKDATGSRELQDELDAAPSDEVRLAIALGLKGHVREALECPYGNYVLQKCVVTMLPQDLQFIIDELLCGCIPTAARHKYGCRVLQRLLEHCRDDQIGELVEALLVDAVQLSKHAYGSYVVQHIFEHGTSEHQQAFMAVVIAHAATLGADSFGCAVVHKALVNGDSAQRISLCRRLLEQPYVLQKMSRGRRGHHAVKAMLQILFDLSRDEPSNGELSMSTLLEVAKQQIFSAEDALRTARYGRSVLDMVRHNRYSDARTSTIEEECDHSDGQC